MPFRGEAIDWKQVNKRWLGAWERVLYHTRSIGLHGIHGIAIGSIGPHLARLELRNVPCRKVHSYFTWKYKHFNNRGAVLRSDILPSKVPMSFELSLVMLY